MINNEEQIEIEAIHDSARYFSIIESILFVSGDPLSIEIIADIIQCSKEFAIKVMQNMMESYEEHSRGIKVIKLQDTYQLVTKGENSQYIQKLLKTNTRQSLSQAALEVLSIIAYKQPITRIEIDEVRGVKSDRALATLQEKGLIKENGRKDMPGRPILYSTTTEFLKYFELEGLNELPNMEDIAFDLES
ncbi:SMC-Scp complex subunit ScpB [Hathewaya massiliensis]|uniref:SMC-Scp complex subunit ScpB n=1 Tax=Hathewaya massiliensis TaxID=1964382 RepID=UPI00163D2545|nr:SMC-Scp complex subunit ScpB [Hathewaya massiliensis]